ncbi:MAG: asparagine synthase-related protein [cyanobacterium endosymbiont of Rhopalodia sterrenbergii]
MHTEFKRSVNSLHHINLQHVYNLTMAHSIEGRVPFLYLKMIELG